MLRVFKYYDFPLKQGGGARTVGFSSYPGAVSSTDDYYVTSNKMVVTETTISLLTDEPYDHLDDTGKAMPDFIRIMAATFAANSGEDWVDSMTESASGLYGSQWMVVDYKKFQPGQPVPDGTLMVLEQVPTINHNADMSGHLREKGFWSSENRAYFPDARQVAGFAEAEDMHGNLFSADHNPRANIFAATEAGVNSLADMRAEMRRNRWPHEVDGGPENTPDHAISARSDLAKENASPNGGVDAKVADSCMVNKIAIDAICGPTEDQKVFSWTDPVTHKELWADVVHEGLPDSYNFPWVRMTPDGYAVGAVAGGCFWGTELHLQRVDGVIATAVGYTQGRVDRPTYKQVSSGLTGHAEALMFTYDPAVVSYGELCDKLIATVDSTRLNCVGNDFGTQYRHGIYPHSPEQMEAARACVARVQAALPPGKRCHTEVVEAQVFWPAEEMHQQYLQKGGRLGSPQSASKGCTDSVRCYG